MDSSKAKEIAEGIVGATTRLDGLTADDRKFLVDDIANALQTAYYDGRRDGAAHADAHWTEIVNRKHS
jgi:hypothetical protein